MKRVSMFIMVAVMFFSLQGKAFSAEKVNEKGSEQKAYSNSVNLYADWIKTPTKNLFRQAVNVYGTTQQKYGFGIDLKIGNENFTDIRPYATYKMGNSSVTAIAGYRTVSTGDKFVHYGLRFADKFGPINLFADARNYNAVSDLAKSYSDVFVDIVMPVGKRFSVGIDSEHVHQWNNKRDILFIGPVLNTKIGNMNLVTRAEYERHWSSGKTTNGCNARIALTVPF